VPDNGSHEPGREQVDLESLKRGPVRRASLSDVQLARIRRFHEILAEIDGFTLEQRVDGFKRDLNPDSEIEVWEAVAAAFERFCAARRLTHEAQRDVYSLLLRRTMMSEEEALSRSELKGLSKEEAAELLRGLR